MLQARARLRPVATARRQVSYWRAAKTIASKRETARRAQPPPPEVPLDQQTIFPDAYPPNLSEAEVATLQLRSLEDDAVFLIDKRPDLAEELPRFVGKDAVAGARVMQAATQAAAAQRPKIQLAPGTSMPQLDQLQAFSEERTLYERTLRDVVKNTMPAAREAAEQVRKAEGMEAEVTLRPPIEVTVPPGFFVAEVERLAESIEYRATVIVGVAWQHIFSKLPGAVNSLAANALNLRSVITVPAAMLRELRSHAAERLKVIDPSAELPKRPRLEHFKEAWRTWQKARAEHAKYAELVAAEEAKLNAESEVQAKKFMEDEAKKRADAAAAESKAKRRPTDPKEAEMQEEVEIFDPRRRHTYLMRVPRSIDPRDWAVFLFNRLSYYAAYAIASVKAFEASDPFMSEQAKKHKAVVEPAWSNFRDLLLESLRNLEARVPPPWDEQEFSRVREHGMQERMTMKEAALILGMTNERVLKGGFEETEIKEAHRAVMRQNHPDTLGSNYLALKINKAKEVLLKGSGIENERGMYDTERQQRAKLADPEYLAQQRSSLAGDPEVERLKRIDQEAAAAVAAKLRIKRKLRSWYWHKVPLWRRVLGLGGEFFPIEKEALRMYERMIKDKRPDIGRDAAGFFERDRRGYESKSVEYRAQRRAHRRRHREMQWRKLRSRYFAYWFYWRLSRPIPLLWRLPLFVFVRAPILLTFYPLAILGFAIWYPFVLLGRALRPIPRLIGKLNPLPLMYRFVRRSFRSALALPDLSPEASEARRASLSRDFQRFMSKDTLRRVWRRFSDAFYQRAHPELSSPEWDPDFLKKTIREELRGMREIRKEEVRRQAQQSATRAESRMPHPEDFAPPTETADQKRETELLRAQAKRRGR